MVYEYAYQTSKNDHHHSYILPSLMPLIEKIKINYEAKGSQLRILDLGSGNGSLTACLANEGYEVVGVEESKSGVEIAKQNFPQCTFIQGSIYDLPYQHLEKQFDLVIAVDVIEHLFYPRELVKAAKRCLKPNCHLIVTTPYHGYLKNLALAITGKMDTHYTALWDGGHIKFFSVNTLTNLLASEDYTHIKFKFVGRIPYLWKNMICSSVYLHYALARS